MIVCFGNILVYIPYLPVEQNTQYSIVLNLSYSILKQPTQFLIYYTV